MGDPRPAPRSSMFSLAPRRQAMASWSSAAGSGRADRPRWRSDPFGLPPVAAVIAVAEAEDEQHGRRQQRAQDEGKPDVQDDGEGHDAQNHLRVGVAELT